MNIRKLWKKFVNAVSPCRLIVLCKKYKEYSKKQKEKKEYVFDIILSTGIECRTAHYLKKHGLRFCANPLDWMIYYSLDTVVHLYKTGFNDFFVDFTEDKQKSLGVKGRWFIDTRNNISSIHYDYIETDNAAFRKTMKARFEKINKILIKAAQVCFISCRSDDVDVMENFLKAMSELYSGEITYINIRDNKGHSTSPVTSHEKKVSEKLRILEYEFNDVHPDGDDRKNNSDYWKGNYIIWDTIMEKIGVNNKTSFLSWLFKNKEKY